MPCKHADSSLRLVIMVPMTLLMVMAGMIMTITIIKTMSKRGCAGYGDIHDDGVAAGCDDTVLVVTRSAATTAVCSSTQYDCCRCRCSSLRAVVIFAAMSVGDTTGSCRWFGGSRIWHGCRNSC